MQNYFIVYLGSLSDYENELKYIFNITSYNICGFLMHPFGDCNSKITGIINFINNINSIFPNQINFKTQKKLYRFFIIS